MLVGAGVHADDLVFHDVADVRVGTQRPCAVVLQRMWREHADDTVTVDDDDRSKRDVCKERTGLGDGGRRLERRR